MNPENNNEMEATSLEKIEKEAVHKVTDPGGISVEKFNNIEDELIQEKKKIENQKKIQEKKEGILAKFRSFFKEKPITEITDRVKLESMAREDAKSLFITKAHDTEIGSIGVGNTYRDLAKKYNLGQEGERLMGEIEATAKELSTMSNSPEKQSKMEEFNDKRKEFAASLHTAVEKRINELN